MALAGQNARTHRPACRAHHGRSRTLCRARGGEDPAAARRSSPNPPALSTEAVDDHDMPTLGNPANAPRKNRADPAAARVLPATDRERISRLLRNRSPALSLTLGLRRCLCLRRCTASAADTASDTAAVSAAASGHCRCFDTATVSAAATSSRCHWLWHCRRLCALPLPPPPPPPAAPSPPAALQPCSSGQTPVRQRRCRLPPRPSSGTSVTSVGENSQAGGVVREPSFAIWAVGA